MSSRLERILRSKIEGTPYTEKPRSSLESLLLDLNVSSGADTSQLTQKVMDLQRDYQTLQSGISDAFQNLDESLSSLENVIYGEDETTGLSVSIETLENTLQSVKNDLSNLKSSVQTLEEHGILDSLNPESKDSVS